MVGQSGGEETITKCCQNILAQVLNHIFLISPPHASSSTHTRARAVSFPTAISPATNPVRPPCLPLASRLPLRRALAAALQDGPQGFFRGYLAFLARDLPFDAIEFVSYEQLRIVYLVRIASCAAAYGNRSCARCLSPSYVSPPRADLLYVFSPFADLRYVSPPHADTQGALAAAASSAAAPVSLSGLENSVLGAVAGGLTGAVTTPLGALLSCAVMN